MNIELPPTPPADLASEAFRLEQAEQRYEAAQARLEQATGPIAKLSGRISVWAAKGDLHTTGQHFDIAVQIAHMQQQAGEQ